MRTLLDILKATTTYFSTKGLENSRRQAEQLIAAALNCRRLDLYLQFERPLPEEKLGELRDWVRRRAAREPLQYITGEAAFREIILKCDRRALIPRPETEELVGMVRDKLPAREAVAIADLGTGTGAIALSLVAELPGADVLATDISEPALALARENAARLGLEARVRFLKSDWLENVDGEFDAIVSNPPYLTEAELGTAEPEVAKHEPRNALVAADDGLAAHKAILAHARRHLRKNGFVALETGIAHAAALAAFADAQGYARHESAKDMSGRDRFFCAWVA